MTPERYAVILSGGRGERFWPLSTRLHPKQLLALVGGKPLLTAAVDRLEGAIRRDRIFIVTSRELVPATRALLPDFPESRIIGEPERRDTAAAVALGSALVARRNPRAAFCVLTADHIIAQPDRFRQALESAFRLAEADDWLVTMGIRPTFPSTGFGYVEAGDPVPGTGAPGAYGVRRFVEKPDAPTAARYVASGRFFWNSGMFIWRVDAIQQAFRRHCPALAALCEALGSTPEADWNARLEALYAPLQRISIDYAVMEKADRLAMVPGDFGWDDVGSWPALANHFPADGRGNVAVGQTVALDASRNIVVSGEGRLTALFGVDDLIVVQAPGATLVCRKDRAQDLKKLVQELERQGAWPHLL